nr:immunoglobulin light chain junction region [Macaca mulatta]
CQQESNCPTF